MEINLLPQESVVRRYSVSLTVVVSGALFASTVCCLVLGAVSRETAAHNERLAESMQSQAAMLQSQVNRLRSAAQASGAGSTQGVPDLRQLVWDVRRSAPAGVSIQAFTWQDGQSEVTGTTPSLAALSTFETTLSRIEGARVVWVQTANRQSAGFSYDLKLAWGSETP